MHVSQDLVDNHAKMEALLWECQEIANAIAHLAIQDQIVNKPFPAKQVLISNHVEMVVFQ
jgi:hypothetical protein